MMKAVALILCLCAAAVMAEPKMMKKIVQKASYGQYGISGYGNMGMMGGYGNMGMMGGHRNMGMMGGYGNMGMMGGYGNMGMMGGYGNMGLMGGFGGNFGGMYGSYMPYGAAYMGGNYGGAYMPYFNGGLMGGYGGYGNYGGYGGYGSPMNMGGTYGGKSYMKAAAY